MEGRLTSSCKYILYLFALFIVFFLQFIFTWEIFFLAALLVTRRVLKDEPRILRVRDEIEAFSFLCTGNYPCLTVNYKWSALQTASHRARTKALGAQPFLPIHQKNKLKIEHPRFEHKNRAQHKRAKNFIRCFQKSFIARDARNNKFSSKVEARLKCADWIEPNDWNSMIEFPEFSRNCRGLG